MKMNITKTIGKHKYPFQVEGKNLFEMVMESQKLSFDDVEKCGICGKNNLILNARIAQGYKYVEVKCLDCRASLTFGNKKDETDTYYLRRNNNKELDWKAYEGE